MGELGLRRPADRDVAPRDPPGFAPQSGSPSRARGLRWCTWTRRHHKENDVETNTIEEVEPGYEPTWSGLHGPRAPRALDAAGELRRRQRRDGPRLRRGQQRDGGDDERRPGRGLHVHEQWPGHLRGRVRHRRGLLRGRVRAGARSLPLPAGDVLRPQHQRLRDWLSGRFRLQQRPLLRRPEPRLRRRLPRERRVQRRDEVHRPSVQGRVQR